MTSKSDNEAVRMMLDEMIDMHDKPWTDTEDMANMARFARRTLVSGSTGEADR